MIAEGLRQALTACMHRISTIRTSLSRFTYPEKVHHENMHKHGHHHHHHYHHSPGYLVFDSIFGPYAHLSVHSDHSHSSHHSDHHHRDTAFHRLLMEWRSVQNTVIQAVEDFRVRVQKRAADKKKEIDAKKKAETERDRAVQEERDKWQKIIAEKEKENEKLEKKVMKEEQHQETLREKEEKRKEELQDEVNKAGIHQLKQDPFEGMEKVGKVMGKIRNEMYPVLPNPGQQNIQINIDDECWQCVNCRGWNCSHHHHRSNHHDHGHTHNHHHHICECQRRPALVTAQPQPPMVTSQQPTVLNQIQLDVAEDTHISTPALKTTSNPGKAAAAVNAKSSKSRSPPEQYAASISEAGTTTSTSSSASSSTVDLTTMGVDPPRIQHLTWHHDDHHHGPFQHNNHHHHHGQHAHHYRHQGRH